LEAHTTRQIGWYPYGTVADDEDPRRYTKHRPAHGRSNVPTATPFAAIQPVGVPTPVHQDVTPVVRPASFDSIQMELSKLRRDFAELRAEREDTGVFRVRAQDIAQHVDVVLSSHDDAKREQSRRAIIRWVIGLIITGALSGGGYFAVVRPNLPSRVEVSDVQETVESRSSDLDQAVRQQATRVDIVEKKIDRLENVAVEQQVLLNDGVQYLGDKIDKISSRAREIEEPETLKASKEKSQREKARRDLFDGGDE
jgi:hypothetical protein